MQYEHTTAFQNPRFQSLFQTYIAEMNIQVRDWAALFQEMDQDGLRIEVSWLWTAAARWDSYSPVP